MYTWPKTVFIYFNLNNLSTNRPWKCHSVDLLMIFRPKKKRNRKKYHQSTKPYWPVSQQRKKWNPNLPSIKRYISFKRHCILVKDLQEISYIKQPHFTVGKCTLYDGAGYPFLCSPSVPWYRNVIQKIFWNCGRIPVIMSVHVVCVGHQFVVMETVWYP